MVRGEGGGTGYIFDYNNYHPVPAPDPRLFWKNVATVCTSLLLGVEDRSLIPTLRWVKCVVCHTVENESLHCGLFSSLPSGVLF
jgi:hypothetical protein